MGLPVNAARKRNFNPWHPLVFHICPENTILAGDVPDGTLQRRLSDPEHITRIKGKAPEGPSPPAKYV
jgi:hypothetical protein